jgi:hypothetical protein
MSVGDDLIEISVNYQGPNSVVVKDALSLHGMDYTPGGLSIEK